MQPLIHEITGPVDLDAVAATLSQHPMTVYLRGGGGGESDRIAILATDPFLTFTSIGDQCRIQAPGEECVRVQGNPWTVLQDLFKPFQSDAICPLPELPAGGCFGYWGYHLKDHVEPTLKPRLINDGTVPDCVAGFYGSFLAQERGNGKTWVISTGLKADGSRTESVARRELNTILTRVTAAQKGPTSAFMKAGISGSQSFESSMAPARFMECVQAAKAYIRAGDIYQVNLSYRAECGCADPWQTFLRLSHLSPSPYAAWMHAGTFQIGSSSPEQFLKISGPQVRTRPIKGTRPRGKDSSQDEKLAAELQASPKERAELLMITDLLRNDLGRVCQYGSVHVPELVTLEKFSHVQHLVATVEGRLRAGVSHLDALKACFPGGSITGAPKFRAMQIIDELESVPRGIYTGAMGYLGFNQESQLSIVIRTVLFHDGRASFNVGSGIVADSDPRAEFEETRHKAEGIVAALTASISQQTEIQLMVYIGHKGGRFVPEDQAVVSVFDRGFLYGDGLFETVRVTGGRLFRWEDHFNRLRTGASELGISFDHTAESLSAISGDLVQMNGISECLLRIAMSRGRGRRGYSPAGAEEPTLVISTHPLPSDPEKLRNWRLAISRFVFSDPLAGVKTSSKLPFVLARAEAEKIGCDDTLLTTRESMATETAGANIFWIRQGTVCTPPAGKQVLAGITRKVLFEICRKRGLKLSEEWIGIDPLKSADAIFLTQTTHGIIQVVELDGQAIPTSPITAQLHQEYQALLSAARLGACRP